MKWEFTRTEEFTSTVTRHPMKITIKLGAKKDGTLTAMQIHTVSNTGAYGNHGGEVLASSLGSAMATYRCSNKKGIGYAVYTNTVPSGAFRGYGATQPAFAIESAIDELGRKLGIDPFTMRRKNMIRPTIPCTASGLPARAAIGSYGLDQCLDFVEQALASGRGEQKPDGDEWLEGRESPSTRRTVLLPRSIARKPTCRCNRMAPTTWPSDRRNSAMASGTRSARSPPRC